MMMMMNPTTVSPMSSSPPDASSMMTGVGRRGSLGKMATTGGGKSTTGRSPRSRYSLTYADWITRALMAAKDRCACLSDIYEWMSFNVPGLQEQRFLHSSKGWKNAVRHTLSINPRFQKLKRLGKPALWTLSEDYLRQAQALTKISMSIGAPRHDSVQLGSMESAMMDTNSNHAAAAPLVSSPQSKICYVGKASPESSSYQHHPSLADLIDQQKIDPTSFPSRMAQEIYRNNAVALAQEQAYRNSTQSFLPNGLGGATVASTTTTTAAGPSTISTPGLIQASCDAAAAVANRAAFLSDLSALVSLNALITANNETAALDAAVDPLRHRFSAMAAAESAAFAAALGAGANQSAAAPAQTPQSNVAVTPPLMNFFTPVVTSPFNSVSRRGSGDSGISTISNISQSSNITSSSLGGGESSLMMKPFTQSLDVTTLNGMEATLVLPRPLPIQCLTDHKLLLASLIWPNPAVGFLGGAN